jgi:sodium-dependent dicarboxylate transporter 2/3/5
LFIIPRPGRTPSIPREKAFALSPEGKGALAVFLLAATWWVFEVVPIGVTSLTIGVLQVLFFIRPAKDAFKDFMDPSVLFIFGSIVVGLVFTKTGLTRRIAYKMLGIVGEKTSMIYLGCFVLTSALTHIMAHTAVAATIYPLLVAIYAMYGEGDKPTKFGKGLFIGMAYIAGAGSIVTLLGAARGAVALGFYNEVAGKTVGFFELSYYMAPIGWLMTFLLWGFFMVVMKPEKATIPGLREKAKRLSEEMGGITKKEIIAAVIVGTAILVLGVSAVMKSTMPEFRTTPQDRRAADIDHSLFATGLLDINDLEEIPWNIILLFAGAMSIGFLPLADRRGRMDGRELADHVQGIHWFRLRHEHRLFRHDDDQLHHECGGHRHLPAGGPGHRALPGRVPAKSSCLPPWWWPVCPSSCWWAPHPMPSPTTPSSSPPASFSCGEFRPASF